QPRLGPAAPGDGSLIAMSRTESTAQPWPKNIPQSRRAVRNVMIEFTRILCPIDFSESSLRSLDHAAALADWYKAQLTVLHVVPTFEPMQVRGDLGEPIQVVNPVAREQVLDELQRAVQRTTAPGTRTLTAVAGDTTKTITDQALSIGADLIVMGTHG